jgi:hypothetical protein
LECCNVVKGKHKIKALADWGRAKKKKGLVEISIH